jgi:hypothetical protein
MRDRPADFQRGLLANEKFRTAVYANVEGVRTIRHNFCEAFLLQVQAVVSAVQDHAQGMSAGGEGAVEMERFAQMRGV